VALLVEAGHRVVVTGGPGEAELTRRVSGDVAVDLGGRTALRTLAGVLRSADVVTSGTTGHAHLATAVRTPVVSLCRPGLDEITGQDVVCAVRKLLTAHA
jgi:ADP-heptose:LPS heptosyltransferase